MDSKTVARALAEESIVLLKNNGGLLPLAPGAKAAVFGRTQVDTIFSGNGSGAARADGGADILTACEQAGLLPEPGLAAFYRAQLRSEQENAPKMPFTNLNEFISSGLIYEIFGKYNPPKQEFPVEEGLLDAAAAYTDTAILVLGRNSGGEECDRYLEEDYCLTASERALAEQVCSRFHKVVLILNVNGQVDLSWTEELPQIRSILFIGIPGVEGTAALADILTGRVNPSGKLAFTAARRYEDFPTARHFSWDKTRDEAILTYDSYGLDAAANGSTGFAISPVTVYQEDIYLGYRWFDAFGVQPLYPFGFGLSYTEFDTKPVAVNWSGSGILLTVRVKNIGKTVGKQVVQCYLAARTNQKRPARKLVGFEKTGLLASGEKQILEIFVPWEECAAYEEDRASYIIGKGEYLFLLGSSSRELVPGANVEVPEDVTVRRCANRLGLKPCNAGKVDFTGAPDRGEYSHVAFRSFVLEQTELPERALPEEPRFPVVETLSDLELAALCVGYGPGVPFAGMLNTELPKTAVDSEGRPVTCNSHSVGFDGYVSPAIPEKGIFSAFYKDGPAGVGETAWPAQMLMACCFNRQLWTDFGDAVGAECEKQQVDVWLAPAVNLQRNPLGGRNFEYYSEDPFLTGTAAVCVARGVQENHPVLVCPKHFAANEQETFRRGSTRRNVDAVDSIVTEHTLRELYLKPFQMLVEQANIRCIMTSFNKINGTFAAGSRDLCTHILREEWGFRGVVVTDWGDMDTVVDGADAVAAGNDVVMPGGPPVIEQILAGLKKGTVTREDMICAVKHLLTMTAKR